ncbi:MAG: hypothetical protein IPF49_21295 [Gammaproteobacteria bacterium]|nr:hypothetical protein [Gammaproteobacteria bacterium]
MKLLAHLIAPISCMPKRWTCSIGMMLLGYKRVIVDGPKLVHNEGTSFNGSRNRAVMMTIGKLLFAHKHYCAIRYLLLKLLMLGVFFFERLLDAYAGTGTFEDAWAFTMRCWKEEYPP